MSECADIGRVIEVADSGRVIEGDANEELVRVRIMEGGKGGEVVELADGVGGGAAADAFACFRDARCAVFVVLLVLVLALALSLVFFRPRNVGIVALL